MEANSKLVSFVAMSLVLVLLYFLLTPSCTEGFRMRYCTNCSSDKRCNECVNCVKCTNNGVSRCVKGDNWGAWGHCDSFRYMNNPEVIVVDSPKAGSDYEEKQEEKQEQKEVVSIPEKKDNYDMCILL